MLENLKRVYETLGIGKERVHWCNEGLRKELREKGIWKGKLEAREHGHTSPHHLVIRVEGFRGPGRYHVEGAVGRRGLCPYAEQGGGSRKAPKTAERGAASQGGWLGPECQAAQCSPQLSSATVPS